MIVPWNAVRIIDLPLERMRFERDPFDLASIDPAQPDRNCGCEKCRWRRGLKAAMQTAISDVSTEAVPAPVAPVVMTPLPKIAPLPAITGFDVHGAPERPAVLINDAVDLPASLSWFLDFCSRMLRLCVSMFYLAVLSPRRERRRLLRVFRGEAQ